MKILRRYPRLTAGNILVSCAALVALLGVSAASQVYAASTKEAPRADGQRLISVHEKGETRSFVTAERTLRDAFKKANIAIDEHDLIEPGLDKELVASQYDVNVYRARPVTVIDGSVRTKIISPYQTAEQIANHAGVKLHDEDNATMAANTDMLHQGAGVQVAIDRATPFTLILYGKKVAAYSQAATVGEMLAEKNITLGASDTLSVATDAPLTAGMKVELWRNGKQVVTEEKSIAFPVEQIKDMDREVGYKEVKTPGEKGKRTVSYEIVMKNGKEVSRKEIRSVTTKQPKKQVEIVGGKFNYTGGPLNEEQITFLGTCESGMTPTRNSGNGFYGAFQFMPDTWSSVAPSAYRNVLPHEAPLAVQKQAVQNLLSGSNIFTQFPGCAKQMRAKGII